MGSDEIALAEEQFEPVRVPKGTQFVLIRFLEPGSAMFDMQQSADIHAGQLFSIAGFLDEQARAIIRSAEFQKRKSMIHVPGRG